MTTRKEFLRVAAAGVVVGPSVLGATGEAPRWKPRRVCMVSYHDSKVTFSVPLGAPPVTFRYVAECEDGLHQLRLNEPEVPHWDVGRELTLSSDRDPRGWRDYFTVEFDPSAKHKQTCWHQCTPGCSVPFGVGRTLHQKLVFRRLVYRDPSRDPWDPR